MKGRVVWWIEEVRLQSEGKRKVKVEWWMVGRKLGKETTGSRGVKKV